ncbi:hypothetical protein AVEN_243010-1 [Araneus ventricosus]|uniref:Transcriptional coactivator p15 (PC4) C-terminal domain-containing protein n=1 Tax=Araneus ventricosus TaxID=182803 RepID=A0A4Y2D4W2_ARAVE|nr:hypothetical protein AVEN_243010-1 [Araneus ventricosus]
MVHLGDGFFPAVNTFQKETRVHIRVYSTDDNGFLHPTKEGVSLKPEVWSSVLSSLRTFPDYNFVGVYVVGQPVPHNPLKLSFDANNYIKGYYSLFSGNDKFGQNQGLFISREEYTKGDTLFAFNLSPDFCNGDHLNIAI